MKISVRYFASLREALGPGEDVHIEAAAPETVGELLAWLATQSTLHDATLKQGQAIRAASGQVMCTFDEPLRDGDEIAFFPPVTGG